MAKKHWTQTRAGKLKMSEIASRKHANGGFGKKSKKKRKYTRRPKLNGVELEDVSSPQTFYRLTAYVWADSGDGGSYHQVQHNAPSDLDLLGCVAAIMTSGQPYSDIRIERVTV